MSGNGNTGGQDVRSYKALPRDPNQPEHKRPRVFLHRPAEASDPSIEDEARKKATLIEAAKTIEVDDFTKFHHKPCVRNALLPGISAGTIIGAGRFVLGASLLTACNWASGSFVGISVIVYNFCQRQRALQKDGIRRAVRVLDQKQAMKDAETAEAVTEQPAGRQQKQPVNFWSTFKFW